MHKGKVKEQKSRPEDKQPICSNELLAAIREQMAKRRSGPKEQQPKELKIEEPE